jgi:hypothetical protein
MARKYPNKDLKLLWGLSAGRCAFPNCRHQCIALETDFDATATLGKIAHIIAHSDDGPRANPAMPLEDRDCYENWMLLCPTHHDLVDVQPNTYTVEDLQRWKREHEQWVQESLAEAIPAVTFVELEMIARSIIHAPLPAGAEIDFKLTNPRDKMAKNGLTQRIEYKMTIGIIKAREVQDFVNSISVIDSFFSENLKSGFVNEYNRLRDQGLEGDALFEGLHEFASPRQKTFESQAAGLAVIVYLFEKCDLFEP